MNDTLTNVTWVIDIKNIELIQRYTATIKIFSNLSNKCNSCIFILKLIKCNNTTYKTSVFQIYYKDKELAIIRLFLYIFGKCNNNNNNNPLTRLNYKNEYFQIQILKINLFYY